jgi:PAS domain S-box-containing protein
MKTLKARNRIFDGFVVASVSIALALGALVYTQMRRIDATAIRVTGDTMPSIYLSGQLQSITLLRYILLTDYVNQRNEKERAELTAEVHNANTRIDGVMSKYETLIDVPADSQLFEKLKAARKPYDECYLRVFQLSREGKREQAVRLIETQLIPLRNAFLDAAEAEVVWNKADADDSANAITTAVNWTSTVILVSVALLSGIASVVLSIRKQLRIERTLRGAEERFHEVFEHAPVGICVAGLDGRFIQANSAFCRITGYAESELLARTWPELCHPDDLADALQLRKRLRSNRVGRAVEERRYLLRNGTAVWCRESISMLKKGDENPLYSVVHVEDITERKQAEEALRESEERFRSMADSTPSMMWVSDAKGKIAFINLAYREFSGVTCEEAQIGEWRLLLHPDDVDKYIAEFKSATDEHKSFSAEARVRRADGEWRLVGTRAEPRFSPQGEYLGHIGLRADITERRQAEQERQFQHSLIRAIYEGSLDGILVVNEKGEIASHNKRFFHVWGIPVTEIVGTVQAPRKGSPPQLLLQLALTRVKRPEEFLLLLQRLFADPDGIDNCEIEMKDGRTLERYSTSLRNENGTYLARVLFYRDISDRNRSQEALRESEERFRIMADSCPIGIWATDPEGGTRFINRTYREFCGTNSELPDPNEWQSRIHPDDLLEFRGTFDLALKEHKSFAAVSRSRRIDGQWRWIESFAEPRFSATGEFLGLVGTGKDITDRRLTEQALQSSEEKFRQLAENIREVFWMMNAAGTEILYVGPAYEQIWGRTCESLYASPMDWMEAIHPEDRATAHETFMRQLQGESIDSEYRISTPDGHERWIRDRAFPIRDQGGELIRIAGIAEEITERKRADQALRSSEEKFRQLAENIREVFYIMSPSGAELQYVSPAIEEVWGLPLEGFYRNPMSWADAIHPDDRERAGLLAARQLQGEPVASEYRIRTPDGKEKWILSRASPIRDQGGELIRVVGIAEEITERKRHEIELTCARAEAEAANRAKSEFLANMSHEIRTPMNGVLGMIGLLLDSGLDKEQRHYAEVVDSSAKSLLTVIDDILDYSKVEAGKLEIDTVDFNLNLLMGDFAEMMAPRIVDKQLEFVCAVAPDVCTFLEGDPGRLRQVLLNLVGNAIKFTHQGEVVVRVDLISETDGEVCLRFTVRDTGIGIPMDRQQALFTSFTQVDASTTRQYGGTGLGLAISKKLVELMGGTIGLESDEGKGSEFWFTLRFGKQSEKRCVDSPKVPVKGTRVLVVDDNATNREVLTAQLQSWGAVVAAVESGSKALACLQSAVANGSPFQLAVLDMMMPGMDGATLGRAILADDTLKSMPLVMMTSLGQRGDAVRFKEIGFAAYLIKPVRQSDLFDCLIAALTGEQQKQTGSLKTHHSLLAAHRVGARILLVEDNLTNQEVASGMLRRMGWYADVTANGKQALKALETQPYDLVLMDVQMPEMDGYEATRIIRDTRSSVLNHNIPIIATTAHAMAGDAERCLVAGMSDYISKPVDPKRLANVVEKWLARKVHGAPEEAPVASMTSSNAPPSKAADVSMDFNRELFLTRMMGDEGFAREIAAQFLAELPSLLDKLKEGIAQKDLESVWKQAHKMKGSAANVGGEALREIALELEKAGKARDMATVVRGISELEMRTARLSVALQQFVN